MKKLVNYAHRGASAVCPENTMAAFRKAIEIGATGIETDVQISKDGQLVLIHDEALKRTTGAPGWVKDLTLEELKKLSAGSWFHSDFKDETIPTLDELLTLTKDTDLIVNLELKNGIFQYPNLEAKTIAKIRAYGMTDRVIISSFNHYSLVLCNQLAPDIQTGILYMEGLFEPWVYAKRIGATALHAFHFAVIPEWVAEARKQGVIYNPFTVNDPMEMKRLISAGVAGIITDYPDRLAALLANIRE